MTPWEGEMHPFGLSNIAIFLAFLRRGGGGGAKQQNVLTLLLSSSAKEFKQ